MVNSNNDDLFSRTSITILRAKIPNLFSLIVLNIFVSAFVVVVDGLSLSTSSSVCLCFGSVVFDAHLLNVLCDV